MNNHNTSHLGMVVFLLALAAAPAAWSQPSVHPEFTAHEPSDLFAFQATPAVAGNGSDFLVVWTEYLEDNRVMAARVRGSDGTVLDPGGILIATFSTFNCVPAVTSDGHDFLVVWNDEIGFSASNIYAKRVGGADGLVLDGLPIEVNAAAGDQTAPVASFGGGSYLVAWQDARRGNFTDIYATKVGVDGGVTNMDGVPIQLGDYDKFAPSLAYAGNCFLIAWQDRHIADLDIFARRIGASDLSSMDAEPLPLSTSVGNQQFATVASNGEDFLVAWEDYRDHVSDIRGTRVRGADGAVLEPEGTLICGAAGSQFAPTAASSGGEFLVAWEDYRIGEPDIYGTRVRGSDGALINQDVLLQNEISEQMSPTLAAQDGRYVVAYQNHDPVTDAFRIHGRLAIFPEDRDHDGVLNENDNCAFLSNPDQLDTDHDGIGDACDPDDDNDGAADAADNCSLAVNPDQADNDHDGIGDACDPDDDNDAALDVADNCSLIANPDQADTDHDGLGDACDPDDDNDGAADAADNCPLMANGNQLDTDHDGLGNACDVDDDNDGLADVSDNCSLLANPDQADTDHDGLGNACDPDDDNDGVADGSDNCPFASNPTQSDADHDGLGDACDDPSLVVRIHVKPDGDTTAIHLCTTKIVDLIIFGASGFDASKVSAATVRLAGAKALKRSDGTLFALKDVNRDGRKDMVIDIRVIDMSGLFVGYDILKMTGALTNGTSISGSEKVKVVK